MRLSRTLVIRLVWPERLRDLGTRDQASTSASKYDVVTET